MLAAVNSVTGLVPETLGRQVTGTEVFIDGLTDATKDEGVTDDTWVVVRFLNNSMDEGFKDETKNENGGFLVDTKDEGLLEDAKDERFTNDIKDDGFLEDTREGTMEFLF